MRADLIEIITSDDAAVRNRSLDGFCRELTAAELLEACGGLDRFRRGSENLYQRVRALFFLSGSIAIIFPRSCRPAPAGWCPTRATPISSTAASRRRSTRSWRSPGGEQMSDTIASALAAAYHALGFQTLADQVRRSVRSVRGNQWMFRMGHPGDHPLEIRTAAAWQRPTDSSRFPSSASRRRCAWTSRTAAGATSSSWAWIFPKGARVLNVSVDLGVRGRDAQPQPPIEVYLRVIDQPVLRLVERRPEVQGRHHRRWPTCSISPRITWGCSRRP